MIDETVAPIVSGRVKLARTIGAVLALVILGIGIAKHDARTRDESEILAGISIGLVGLSLILVLAAARLGTRNRRIAAAIVAVATAAFGAFCILMVAGGDGLRFYKFAHFWAGYGIAGAIFWLVPWVPRTDV